MTYSRYQLSKGMSREPDRGFLPVRQRVGDSDREGVRGRTGGECRESSGADGERREKRGGGDECRESGGAGGERVKAGRWK